MIAGLFGFSPRPFFAAQPGAEKAPTVNFNFGSPGPAASRRRLRLRLRKVDRPAPSDDVRYGAEGALLLASSEGLLDPRVAAVLLFVWGRCRATPRKSFRRNQRLYFNDYAGVVPKEAAHRFNEQLAPIRARDLKPSRGRGVSQNAKRLGDCRLHPGGRPSVGCWAKGERNGVVLFVFTQDRKMFIQVGYGLEGALPDPNLRSTSRNTGSNRIFGTTITKAVWPKGSIRSSKRFAANTRGTGKTVAERHRNAPAPSFLFFIILSRS